MRWSRQLQGGNLRTNTWWSVGPRGKKRPLVFFVFALFSLLWAASYDGLMPPLAACHCNSWCVLSMLCSLLGNAIRAIKGLIWPLSPYSVGDGLDWRRHNEDDGEWHSNITFIERRHTCWTELLKNDDGRTDGHVFSSPPPPAGRGPTGRGGSSGLTWRRLTSIYKTKKATIAQDSRLTGWLS